MIIVKLTGGLGNQMFQYAAARRLSLVSQASLKFDTNWFNSYHPDTVKRNLELDVFSVKIDEANKTEISKLKKLRGSFFELVLATRLPKIHKAIFSNKSSYFLENQYCHFENDVLKPVKNRYLDGNWQSEKYFSDVSKIIRQDFIFNTKPSKKNSDCLKIIRGSNSVSLHIRRTDFVTDQATNNVHGVCSMSYYQKSLQIIKKFEKKLSLFIFSDDIAWARQNLKTDLPTNFVDFNRGNKNFEDLRLMSNCKHNIIANSSFSWWGAWLNTNPQKKVIAPKKWFNEPNIDSSNIIPEQWIKI